MTHPDSSALIAASFDRMWSDLDPIGRHRGTGGYRRFAWTDEDSALREWFAGQAGARGLDLTTDRAGNQWAWWGDPDRQPGVVVGSHLDSVPDGGAFDGPLGVVSAFAALDALRNKGLERSKPIAVVNFGDEEGARFGIACAGSRIITGDLTGERARGLTDATGIRMAEAAERANGHPEHFGRDEDTLKRVGVFVELHVEQGRGLIDMDRPVAVASSIRPHGRWRLDFLGQANHAGTARLDDRNDPMLAFAEAVLTAREEADRRGIVATIGKVAVLPNGVNAIPSQVTAWLDARGAEESEVRTLAEAVVHASGGTAVEESWTAVTRFDESLAGKLSKLLDDAPQLATGAGHDAGILALAGIPSAMLFVRNPTGISHSPAEFAERGDCLIGVEALVRVIEDLAR